MARSRLLAVLAVVLVLVPAGIALADSAGDNQYQDPFGGSQPQKTTPQTTSTPAATAPSQPAPSAPAASQPAADPAAASQSGQLPRTGLDLRIVAGLGVVLVGGGLVLRRRLG